MDSILRSGRLKRAATVRVVEISSCAGCPPEAIIAPASDSDEDSNDNFYGTCWAGDIARVLKIAELEGDTDLRNPNLPVLRRTFEQMSAMRETREAFEKRVSALPSAQIIPLRL